MTPTGTRADFATICSVHGLRLRLIHAGCSTFLGMQHHQHGTLHRHVAGTVSVALRARRICPQNTADARNAARNV